MSPINPEALARANRGELIDRDRPCAGCGYNLRGLYTGNRCPECGRPIAGAARFRGRMDDNLTDAPMGYLRVLALGCFLMMAGSIGTLAMLRQAWVMQSELWAIAAGIAAVAWVTGVFIATNPRRTDSPFTTDTSREWRRTRWVVRIMFLAWIGADIAVFAGIRLSSSGLAALKAGFSPTTGGLLRQADLLAGLAALVGIIAFIPLCLMLTDLAEWAKNSALGERFRGAAWGLAVGGLVVAFSQVTWGKLGPVNFISAVARTLAFIVFVGCFVLFLASLVQLAFMTMWAVHNAGEVSAAEERWIERKAREIERDMEAGPLPPIPSGATFDSKTDPALTTEHAPQSVRQGLRRERQPDVETYELAPEEPDSKKP